MTVATEQEGVQRAGEVPHRARTILRGIATRIGWILVVVWAAVSLTFLLSRVIPADPARLAAGLDAGPEQVAEVRRQLGLDLPVWEQYVTYIAGIVRLDLGDSIQSRQPVIDDVVRFLPATLELVLLAMLVYALVGVGLGVVWATLPPGVRSSCLNVLSVLGAGLPVFWVALVLQLSLASGLGWLPVSGSLDYGAYGLQRLTGFTLLDSLLGGNSYALADAATRLVLPVTVLVLSQLGVAMRLTRSTVSEQLERPYVRTSRARGNTERHVLLADVLRNSLAPVVTMLGLQFGWLLGGTIIVEVIFSWPGLGLFAYNAFRTFDYNSILAITLIITAVFVIVNELTDVVNRWLDPRVGQAR
ncbi:ABC transporter permease [Microbacterium sp. 18062]|uniref:ABC transporter permease n=1 Tax=Microbacterium sp. 18062 TaxID=2681410 RepID=UPI00135C9337|nr:ABC transporter permease [Microbacterium sp. 18062]